MELEKIVIRTENIQLDQFLKWIGVIESGAQVKFMLEDQLILVNGNIETARRRRLFPGDKVEVKEVGSWEIATQGE